MRLFLAVIVLSFCFFATKVQADFLLLQQENHDIKLQVEIADTPLKRTKGLMFRTQIPDDFGMLFLFPETKVVNMWMKNTYIPLDMLFLDENGTILTIIENAKPHDTTLLSSRVPVSAVVEVNGGFCQKRQVTTGQKVVLVKEK